jgi:hypothetical protein
MADFDKKVVTISSRLAKFIGSKATREKKMQAAAMQAEFTLRDTLVILCYLAKDPDPEISEQARRNLIPAARNWSGRPDRPELPEPIYAMVTKVLEKVGTGAQEAAAAEEVETVVGHIGLLGLGEIIQTVDHNNRTIWVNLDRGGEKATVFTEKGKVVGALAGDKDGMEALYKAFGWVDATFTYLHAPPGEFVNRIKVNTLTLVMDALEYCPEEDPFQNDVSRAWQVQGRLKTMNLFEIAEIFEMNSKQAVCRLQREDQEGYLYFNNGRIVNAALADMTGLDAACHLLAWPNAAFTILRGGEDVEEVIHVGMQNLIIEAMRLLDEGVTVTDRIASELAMINELFDGSDVVDLSLMDRVRLVFSDDQSVREVLEQDSHPLVRKAIKVKISKTVHKYLSPLTDHETRLKAARGMVPLSTSEKLVLLTYLSHDESPELKEQAKKTLESLDLPTYRKGFGSELHPIVMDFLVRETIRDETVLGMALSSENILEETALHILDSFKSPTLLRIVFDNKKLLERSPATVVKLAQLCDDDPALKNKIEWMEESMLQGQSDIIVSGPLNLMGLSGLLRAARQGARSGTIVLESSSEAGRVYFKKGKVIGATWGSLEGLPAIEKAIHTADLRFRYSLRTYFHKENLDPLAADDLLNSASASPTASPEGGSGIRLISGSTQVMDIFEILSALEGTPVPVSISIVCEEGAGELYRDRGRILHAAVKGVEDPFRSMAAMLSWNSTRLIVRQALGEFPVTVDKNLQDFFTDSMKLMPEELTRLTKPGEMPEWELSEDECQSLYHRILNMGVGDKVKLAFTGSKEARDILIRDSNKMVSMAVVKSPKIQESEIEAISKSRQVAEDILRYIGSTKEWIKSYQIKVNLASNSKTPLPVAMKLLNQLRETELKKLSKDKNVSQFLATQARRICESKAKR